MWPTGVAFAAGELLRRPLPRADVVMMGHILHDWDLATKKMLIRRRSRRSRRGRLIVYESIIDDERSKNAFGLMMSLNMLIETPGGFDYTGADCTGWMREAGSRHARRAAGRARLDGRRHQVTSPFWSLDSARTVRSCDGDMTADQRLISQRFPRSAKYDPDWIIAGASGGANPLWLTEWLAESLGLQANMRVLDLGCGLALSSVFLRREFGVQVWATDLWFSPRTTFSAIRDAGSTMACSRSMRTRGRCRSPRISSTRSYPSIRSCTRHRRSVSELPGSLSQAERRAGCRRSRLDEEIDGAVPEHLQAWWEPSLCCLHSAAWWRRHWERTGFVDVELADTLPDGWQSWKSGRR